MTLTDQQNSVIASMLEWANDPTSDTLAVLKGYAGTGKTTVLKHFLQEYKYKVAVTAPTHAAVEVASTILQRKGQTLHKLHGLRPNTNLATFDIDNIQFDPLGKPTMSEFSLILIDESSMINASVLKLNNDRAEMFEVKVLFIGDEMQLPPIGERHSQVFDLSTQFVLDKIVRQDLNNPITKVLELLRNDIKSNTTYHALHYMLNNPIGIIKNKHGTKEGYAVLDKDAFMYKLLADFPVIREGKIIKYLSGTNEDVIDMNSYIRNNLISSNELLVEGDLLTSNVNTYDEFQGLLLTNSSDYIVDTVDYIQSEYDFYIYVVNLRNTTTNEMIPTVKIVDHTNTDSWATYKELLGEFYLKAINSSGRNRGANWKAYFSFKSQYLQMLKVDFGKKKVVDRDISYGYASTVHKSQGSTYNITYCNLKSIATYNNELVKNTRWRPYAIEYVNKLIYVALSRATEKNILLWL